MCVIMLDGLEAQMIPGISLLSLTPLFSIKSHQSQASGEKNNPLLQPTILAFAAVSLASFLLKSVPECKC